MYVVESLDYVFLLCLTGLTWGSLSIHLSKLEEAGCIENTCKFKSKKPHITVRLAGQERAAFKEYKQSMRQVLNELPE